MTPAILRASLILVNRVPTRAPRATPLRKIQTHSSRLWALPMSPRGHFARSSSRETP